MDVVIYKDWSTGRWIVINRNGHDTLARCYSKKEAVLAARAFSKGEAQ